jgi:DNA-directed RNA polymerase specialized sigma24 family protein
MEVKAECERQGGGWQVRVPFLNLTLTAKRLDRVTEEIKDLVHQSSGVDRCDIIVKVETSLPGIICDLESAQDKMREAQRLQDEASVEIREVVSRLRAEGLTMRDIAVLMNVSPQRVAQLTAI